MDVYDVTIKTSVYVLANSREEAEEIAKKEMGKINAFLPGRTPDFTFDAYHTLSQGERIKRRAINFSEETK